MDFSQPYANGHLDEHHDDFYSDLTHFSSGMITRDDQHLIREVSVLIAGCGAVGSYTIDGLARAGIELVTLADAKVCTRAHLGRMPIGQDAIGRNRATVMAERFAAINPFADVLVVEETLDGARLDEVLDEVDVVIDTLGIESNADLLLRQSLHQAAKQWSVPIISGFDVASAGWVFLYDYRDPDQPPLNGHWLPDDLDPDGAADPIETLSQMVSLSKVPLEVLREAEQILAGQQERLPRFAFAAQLTSAIICHTLLDLLFDRPVRRLVSIDLASAARPPRANMRRTGQRLVGLYNLRRHLRNRKGRPEQQRFSPLDDRVFQQMRPYMEERTYEQGSVIVRQGEPAHEFFTIVAGHVQVESEDGAAHDFRLMAELGPGDYFGEIALLTGQPRNASVVAAERCKLFVLSRGAFEIYLEESQAASRHIHDLALHRTQERELA